MAPMATENVVIARRTARKAGRSGVIWGYIFGIAVASTALTYTSIYKTKADRLHLAATFGTNNATTALFGPAPQLQTVAGFTVFKTSMALMVLGAVWGLLTSTRLLRGEEDAGRWELLLCGGATRRGAVTQALAGLTVGEVALWAVTGLITTLAGLSSRAQISPGPALYLALALVACSAMWLAIGALTSQLAPTRRQAAAWAAALLGGSYAARLVGDSGTGLHWLVWVSPLGWVEELRPLTAPQPLAIVPVVGLTVVAGLLAAHLASRRDLGASTFADHATASARLTLLNGPVGLAVRTARATLLGWSFAIAVAGVMLGLVAKAAGTTLSGSSVQQIFARLGARGPGTDAYLGVCFLIVAIMVAFVAVGQVTAAREEEASGRLDHLLARPLSRSSWFAGRMALGCAVLVAAGVVAGIFTWLGAATQNSGVGFTTLVSAGLNAVTPALCTFGVGALALGLWPRRASVAAYGLLGWSVLVEVVGGFAAAGKVGHWFLDTSLFHQMASAPAVGPNWVTNGVMTAVGLACGSVGGLAFARRDLSGE
jgi:ABC-2 type transport system permease protein